MRRNPSQPAMRPRSGSARSRAAEYIRGYQWGGLHPVYIGDRLNDRYRIVNKLSYDLDLTSWLAHDEKLSKYVCVKVARMHKMYEDSAESDILSELAQMTPGQVDRLKKPELFSVLHDRFHVGGPNGVHECLVTTPTRRSLQEVKGAFEGDLLQIDVAKSLGAQLVMAVAQVHSKGYAHGDLRLSNILLQFPLSPSLDILSTKQLYDRYGKPQKEPVRYGDRGAHPTDPGIPSYVVKPMKMDKDSENITLRDARLILGGFSSAFRLEDQSQSDSPSPFHIRPPSAYLEPGKPLMSALDIWSLACVLFELYADSPLINGLPIDHYVVTNSVHMKGTVIPEWWAKWQDRSGWFADKNRPWKNSWEIKIWERHFYESIEEPQRLHDMGTMSQGEWDALLSVLRPMLAWRPAERPSVRNALQSDWMTKWALPAYRKTLRLRERRGRRKFSRLKWNLKRGFCEEDEYDDSFL
ncbi:hypothetical protein CPLU01_10420 [Colletotrichum plurivorum]|uniref:Protein kinase domain-containing protein n=1 Tax=Colletotrichum plurivorum TaxID=2175906 RepID=A0A8H6N9J3_9PEZI|nr:hypothetical protein CPLU01_10420 [Colletotrichum plurivorum]